VESRRNLRALIFLFAHIGMTRKAKLTAEDVATIRQRYANGAQQAELAAAYQVTQPNISYIVLRKSWAGAGGPTYVRKWQRGGVPARAKLTLEQVTRLRQQHAEGATPADLSAEFGVNRGTISKIVRGITWRDPQ